MNNIGLIRLLAAYAVLFGHQFNLTSGKHGAIDPIGKFANEFIPFSKGLPGLAVMIFFILSGFLIAKSYERSTSALTFIESRLLRIYPAAIVAVFFCTFVVGAAVTSLSISDYLTHKGTWNFFLYNSSLTEIHFKLPGVFNELPWKGGVNGSLWTLPIELLMYSYVLVLGVLGILKYRNVFNLFAVLVVLLFLLKVDDFPLLIKDGHYYMGGAFLVGVFFYKNFQTEKLNAKTLLLMLVLTGVSYETKVYDLFALFFTAYVVFYVGLNFKYKLWSLDRFGDFSYGIYLYAFPIQQLVIYLGVFESVYIQLLVSSFLTLGCSIFSWYVIEKPSLKLKGKFGKRGLPYAQS